MRTGHRPITSHIDSFVTPSAFSAFMYSIMYLDKQSPIKAEKEDSVRSKNNKITILDCNHKNSEIESDNCRKEYRGNLLSTIVVRRRGLVPIIVRLADPVRPLCDIKGAIRMDRQTITCNNMPLVRLCATENVVARRRQLDRPGLLGRLLEACCASHDLSERMRRVLRIIKQRSRNVDDQITYLQSNVH